MPTTRLPPRLGPWRQRPQPTRPPAIGTSIPIGVPLLPGVLTGARYSVEMAFGANKATDPYGLTWIWVDVSRDVLQADGGGVSIQPIGRGNENYTASPAGCTLRLKNPRGDYTRHNPYSQYWPNVTKNIPIRVRVSLNDGGTWFVRFQGETASLNPLWDTSGNYSIVVVTAAGILRRLQQGRRPLKSAMYRQIVNIDTVVPLAYYSMEDPVNTAQAGLAQNNPTFAEAFGGPSLPFTASTRAASVEAPGGSGPLPDLSSGGAYAGDTSIPVPVRATTVDTFWAIHFAAAMRHNDSTLTDTSLVEFRQGSGATWPDLELWIAGTNAAITLRDTPTLTNILFTYTPPSTFLDETWRLYTFTCEKSGTSVIFRLYINETLVQSTTVVTTTMARITAMQPLPDDALPSTTCRRSFGHFGIYDQVVPTGHYDALLGHSGEIATARLARLYAEEGVPITISGSSSTTMGPQGVDTLLGLSRECEATDGGVLADGLGPGARYTTRTARYNMAAALTLDAALGQTSIEPTDDDMLTRNTVDVSRVNGGTATFADTTSPMGTSIGEYGGQVTVNQVDDGGLPGRAEWEVGKGIVDEFRYPTLSMVLQRDPSLAPTWLAAGDNSRLDITNIEIVRRQHPPGTISQVIEGYAEFLSTKRWEVGLNVSPFRPDQGFTLNDSQLGRLSGVATLVETAYPGATTLQVTTQDTALWSQSAVYPGDYPSYAEISGIRVLVTAVSGAANPQTFTVDPTTVTKQLNEGDLVKPWKTGALML